MASCCPDGSYSYLQSDTKSKGSKHVLACGTEFYHVGSGSKCLIMIPDVWGWDSGRSRVIADYFSDNKGYLVIVPKLLQPPFEGGTDGDGLSPEFNFATRYAEFDPYMKTISWDGVVKPRLQSILEYLSSTKGINQVAFSGYCWGGQVCCKAAGEWPDKISAIAIPHPSITLEERVYGGNSLELCLKVKCPVLLMPAGNDPDDYRPQGQLFEAFKSNNNASEVSLDFNDMKHGWVPRGDLNEEGVSAGVQKAIDLMLSFFTKNYV